MSDNELMSNELSDYHRDNLNSTLKDGDNPVPPVFEGEGDHPVTVDEKITKPEVKK